MVDTAHYVGVTLDTQHTWSTHVDQVRKKVAQRLGVLEPLVNRSSAGMEFCCTRSSSVL